MIFFITCLRALAACLITNSHYTGVYPTDLIANGGLLGDILFFAVSGFCLYNIKGSFPRWYGKRLYRIYPPVILITLVYMWLGFYPITADNAFGWFVYPTNFHFIASILLLYIAYYIVIKIRVLREHLIWIMLAVTAVWLLIYVVFYDKSYYHIDDVHEPMIRFLYFVAMLMGAYFRQNEAKLRNRFSWIYVVGLAVSFAVYFASKLIFVKYQSIALFQPLNQMVIIVHLFFLLRLFAGMDQLLRKMPKWIKDVIIFISKITLELYLVQIVIITYLRDITGFPLNWLLLTTAIFVSAYTLHLFCKGFYYICEKATNAISNRFKKEKQ